MSKLLSLAALGVALAAFSSSAALAQTVSPADSANVSTPAIGSLLPAPLGLYSQSVDWLTLGSDPIDLANVGPTSVTLADSPATGGTLFVGNPLTCKNAQYPTIQMAVTAANPGAHIMVCPGTYTEQVTIPAGKDNLTLQSLKPLQAIIQAPAVMAPPEAIVHIQAQDATIQQFTIQGPGGGPCHSIEYGVFVDGGSATIEHNHITHIRDNPFSGCQNGVGVQVGRFILASTGSATIRNNQIDDYQKNGITIDNAGSSGAVENNLIQGAGPTAVIAQNGIQVSRGATGQLKNNTISGNVYTPGGDSSTGILLYADASTPAAGTVDVENNRLNANDTGVYAYQAASSSTVQNNKVVNNTDDGVTVDTSDGLAVQNNNVQTNDQGVGVYNTSGASIANNNADDNRSNGFYAGIDTSGNTFENNNADDSGLFDCRDDSHGTGTAGTANFWLRDKGDTSSPPGICN
jgi:parallel beta-helix repeat protein